VWHSSGTDGAQFEAQSLRLAKSKGAQNSEEPVRAKAYEGNVANNKETTKNLGGVTGKGFMPGVSGNPEGRPRRRLIDQALEELLQTKDSELATEIAGVLVTLARQGDIKAIQLIAERTQGKPKQAIGLSGEVGIGFDLANEIRRARERAAMSQEELEAKLRCLRGSL
jgi:hypothetical protein